jgi:hypothetical protein
MKLCIDILNKKGFFSSKTKDRKIKWVLSGGLVPMGWGRYREWVKNMVEYYVLMYENGKMRPVETILRIGGRG